MNEGRRDEGGKRKAEKMVIEFFQAALGTQYWSMQTLDKCQSLSCLRGPKN